MYTFTKCYVGFCTEAHDNGLKKKKLMQGYRERYVTLPALGPIQMDGQEGLE